MAADPDNGWKFAQCFGDKGEVEDVTEGIVHPDVHIRLERGEHEESRYKEDKMLCPAMLLISAPYWKAAGRRSRVSPKIYFYIYTFCIQPT
jgi:hypothetical protein